MTTPSGTIGLSDVNTELGYSSTALISMNDSAVRTLAGAGGSGTQITMNQLRGKSNEFNFTISSNTTNANLRTLALSAGWGGTSKVNATIAPGVYVYSTSTGTPGLTIDGAWPGGVTLTNNGYVLGMGGTSPDMDQRTSSPYWNDSGRSGNPGGNAISLGVNVTITNNSYIAGGGGSGGSANAFTGDTATVTGGGGAGGGGSGLIYIRDGSGGGLRATVSGASGGAVGSAGSNGNAANPDGPYSGGSGGGGGRILPGTGGTGPAFGTGNNQQGGGGGGSGGGGGRSKSNEAAAGGGGGGGWGASGGTAVRFYTSGPGVGGGAGGTADASGSNASGSGPDYGAYGGGSGGKAVALNGYSVTWAATGTRYGAIS